MSITQWTLDEYQSVAARTDQTQQTRKPQDILQLGLFGEVGSLVSEVKKKQRDETSYVGYEDTVIEELGDVLWYLAAISRHAGVPLSAVATFDPAVTTTATPAPGLRLDTLQAQQLLPLNSPTLGFERTLFELAAQTGGLMEVYKAGKPSADVLVPHLAAIFKTLIHAANEAQVTLLEAARNNLLKTQDRWPSTKEYPELFDEGYPEEERLPRTRTVEIFERTVNGATYVIQRCNDVLIGDRVTDNIMVDDDYRFHDVFHYSYASILGWSPVIRALFHLKRRSKPRIDHAEDGARAILIEEGISTLIFGRAKNADFFANEKPGDLSFTLLKTVHEFVKGYEPERCPLWLWEDAILKGYDAFRYLKEHRRGKVRLDLDRRTMTVERLP